ncbi:FtsK/SpoIIIE domain-containing protein [Streptomyces varsoviensis]|uniref:FtsK/SpoIIIE domain-containing protein n=1 Tax=Streptomyces varsoviensis TaxID=67373 RepID=UPI0034069E45
MQIRLTVLGPRSGHTAHATPHATHACDVLVTAPAGTALAAVTSGLATAVAAAGSDVGSGAVVVYAGAERLDAQRCALGEPPLVDGAVLALQGPADPDRDVGVLPAGSPDASARLHVVAGPDAGGVHLLHGGRIDIGRSANADVPLDDPDVSRLHCAVTVTDEGRVTVADLGSTNGTTLDGAAVLDHPVPFPSGALLRVGESTLSLRVPTAGAPTDLSSGTLPATPDGEGHLRVTGALTRGDHWPDNAPTPPPDPGTPARGTPVPPGITSPAPTTHGTGFGPAPGYTQGDSGTPTAAAYGTHGQTPGPDGPAGYGPGPGSTGTQAPGAYGTHGQAPGPAGYGPGPGGTGTQAPGAYGRAPGTAAAQAGGHGQGPGEPTGVPGAHGRGPGGPNGPGTGGYGHGQGPGAYGHGPGYGGTTSTPGNQAGAYGQAPGTGATAGHGHGSGGAADMPEKQAGTYGQAPGAAGAAGYGHGSGPGGAGARATGAYGQSPAAGGASAPRHGYGQPPSGGTASTSGHGHGGAANTPGDQAGAYGQNPRGGAAQGHGQANAYGQSPGAAGAANYSHGPAGPASTPGNQAPGAAGYGQNSPGGAAHGHGPTDAYGQTPGAAGAAGYGQASSGDATPGYGQAAGGATAGGTGGATAGGTGGATAGGTGTGAKRRGFGAWARRLAGGRGAGERGAGGDDWPVGGEDSARAQAATVALRERWPDAAGVLMTALGPGPRLWERGPGHPDLLTVRLGTADRLAPDGTGPMPSVPVTVGLREAGALGLAGPRPRLAGLARSALAQLAALHAPGVLETVLISADRSRAAEDRLAEWSWFGWLPQARPAHGQDCRLLVAYDREQAEARTAELVRRCDDGPLGPGWASASPAAVAAAAGQYQGPYTVLVVDGDPGTAALRESVARLALGGPAVGIHLICLAEAPAASPASPVSATCDAARAAAPVFAECGTVALLSGDVATAVQVIHRGTGGGAACGGGPGAAAPGGAPAAPAVRGPVTHVGALAGVDSRGTGRTTGGGPGSGPGGSPGGGAVVATVDAVSPAWAEHFARALAPLRPSDAAAGPGPARVAAALPRTARLLDELGLARATPASLTARWAASADAPGPAAPAGGRVLGVLGAGPRGPLTVDLATDGPHVLVEGGPGTGKTELLRTFAASLAAAERPDRLSLVLVDGAGAERGEGLRVCTDLPQVSTYLAAADPVRMREFAQALSSELKRRAELLGRLDFAGWHAQHAAAPRVVSPRRPSDLPVPGASGTGDIDPTMSGTLKLRTQRGGPERTALTALPRLVVLVDDFDALVAPALGSTGRPAAGSVVRALEAVARDGERLGVHLVAASGRPDRTAETAAVERAGLRIALEILPPAADGPASADGASGEPAPGRGTLRRQDDCGVTPFQAGRVTGRIPRTATLRPTVVPLDWQRMGDPPTRRPLRELGNGPTDLALLASALQRAAQSAGAQTAPPLL